MSRHHIATHAYDFRTGWVRIPPTTMTTDQAEALRDRGFTIVRSRRGWFGARELPLTWYLPRPDTSDPSRIPIAPAHEQGATLRQRLDASADAERGTDAAGSQPPSATRRGRQRSGDVAD
jgi:hypothetical protein